MTLQAKAFLEGMAGEEQAVRRLYQDDEVANKYIAERLKFSWWRHLHKCQVNAVNQVVADGAVSDVLEVAPGPARVTAEVTGVRRGTMVEASPQMIAVAERRMAAAGLDKVWEVREGNAFDLSGLNCEYDFAYTFRFIRHFKEPERRRFYQEIHSRLRPGGLFLFDVVNERVRMQLERASGGRNQGLKVYDMTYQSAGQISTELEGCGFETVSITNVLNHFRFQSWLSHKLDDVTIDGIETAIRLLDKIHSDHPLEWIGLFRKV